MMSKKKFKLILLLFLISASFTVEAPAQERILPRHFRRQKVIVLDPGHGDYDHGALGPSGFAEKDVTLALAKKIKDILAGAYAVHLTRDGDYWLDIEKRTAAANHHRADAFISLHAGGSFDHKARGMAIFLYGPATGQGFAPQQMGHVEEGGEKLRPWDHIQPGHAAKSKHLAALVHQQLLERLNPVDRGTHQAFCSVLQGADMPAILVEIGYVSHPVEEKELRDPEVVSAAAEAISEGIREFLAQPGRCIDGKGMIENL